jgi:hypothetical protein
LIKRIVDVHLEAPWFLDRKTMSARASDVTNRLTNGQIVPRMGFYSTCRMRTEKLEANYENRQQGSSRECVWLADRQR